MEGEDMERQDEQRAAGMSPAFEKIWTPERYKKTLGVADGAGSNYEWKMLNLIFLRMLSAGYEFKLASNMAEAGLFDDVVVKHRKHASSPWKATFLQLKLKRNHSKDISKTVFLGLSGDFSLVKFCASYKSTASLNKEQIAIFTNSSIKKGLVDEVESDQLLSTGGQAVSFKAGGEVHRELCEWVDFKETLIELHGQVEGLSDEEVETRVNGVLSSVVFQNQVVASLKEELLKSPALPRLKDLLKRLKPVSDKETYSSFLAELQVYTGQAHESELDAKIKEELDKVWICGNSLERTVMFHKLQSEIQSWWQNDNFYLTQDSPLWLDTIKMQTDFMSRSTVDGLSGSGAEFVESSLTQLNDKIKELFGVSKILNLSVVSRTAASSLKVWQAFGARNMHVLHVNVKALLAREDDVLSAWATRWCRVLVVECDDELDRAQAARISARLVHVVARETDKKLLILIAPEKHELNVQLKGKKLLYAGSYSRFLDNCGWSDLTLETKYRLLSSKIVINGQMSCLTLSDVVGGDESFVHGADSEVISQMLTGDVSFGKCIEKGAKFFVQRSLRKSADGVPFVVNSVRDVPGKVVLVVAEPGMGKTTLITHLASSAMEDTRSWIVHIRLNDCVENLEEMDMSNDKSAKVFLERQALRPGNSLEKFIFGSQRLNLVVFVDGVDEVCPHFEQEIFTLLDFLRDMDLAQLWVASRPAFQARLEAVLNVKTLHLVALSEANQREICYEVWKAKAPSFPNINSNDSLFEWLTESLGKNNSILGVPLMTAMIAEAFQDEISKVTSENSEFRKKERLDILSLYCTFVAKKFDLYCVEKKKTHGRVLPANKSDEDTLLKRFHHNHRLAALRVLFRPEEIAGLQFEGKKIYEEDLTVYLMEVADGREKTGIIDNVDDGIPHFVHRSFAEYFVASWLAQNFSTNRELMERIIFDPSYELVSEMFHRSLAKDSPLHVAVLNRDLAATKRVLDAQPMIVNDRDAGGRTPLHLAVLGNGTDRHADCASIITYLLKKCNARLEVFDDVISWEPLRYAESCRAWDALDIILGHLEDAADLKAIARKSYAGWPIPDSRFMFEAAKHASARVVGHLADERGGPLDCRGPLGETIVHRAAAGGNVDMLEFLVSRGHLLDVEDSEGNTALRYTSPEAITYLLERGLELEAVNALGLTALQAAAEGGAYDAMPALLGQGAALRANCATKGAQAQLDASLLCAAFAGDLECVDELIRMGASGAHRDRHGHSATWVAMHRKHLAVMDRLLYFGSKERDSQLHAACGKGEVDVVSFVLSASSAGVDVVGRRGQTPLIAAIRAGHDDVVKLLLAKGADVGCRDAHGRTAIYKASLQGDEGLVKRLIRHGADVNVGDNQGRTPILAAVHAERRAIVETLLMFDADVKISDQDGRTPLETASSQGNLETVTTLLLHGGHANAVDVHRRTPLLAATRNNHQGVVRLLLAKKATVDYSDRRGWTPLFIASMRGYCEVADALLEFGADANARETKSESVAKMLLEEKLDRRGCRYRCCRLRLYVSLERNNGPGGDAKPRLGRTPLHAATEWGREDVVALLVRRGACVWCRDGEGRTPLHIASAWGSETVVDFLLGAGADCEVEDDEGSTPMDVAEKRNHSRVMELLVAASLTYTIDVFRKWKFNSPFSTNSKVE